jgi:hypothetical protein
MQWSIHGIFHINLLTPYQETSFHRPNFTRPPPELINGEEEYEVKKILDQWHFSRMRHKQYLIKWKGYPDSENQWVNATDVHAPEALAEFQSSHTLPRSCIRRGFSSDEAHNFFLHNSMSTSPTHSPLANITKSYADAVRTPAVPIIGPNNSRNFLMLSQWRDNVETNCSEVEDRPTLSHSASTSPPAQEAYCSECGLHNDLCKGKHVTEFQI